MIRYSLQLFAVTFCALGLIWFASPGDASQALENATSVELASREMLVLADTMHIKTNENAAQQSPAARRETYLSATRKLTQAAEKIRMHYLEDIDMEAMMEAGISGMLSNLDRYSVLMEKQSYDALMESTHGKYSGLGMQIDSRDDHIVIITPMEGTPAYRKGLRAGDIILSINGTSTSGMKSSDASKLMRGEAGTTVSLSVSREGLPEPLIFEVERAVIELKSVNYAGIIPGTTVGYVRLSRFAEETSNELRTAITELSGKNVSGLVFDLRSNGGGLLDQAKETAELFLKEGREIVSTRGKDPTSARRYLSELAPIFPDKPLVILVDEGTASASEIVAGAIQDWDRGLIIGNTTYGKGLVQQIFPVSNDNSVALKLTTAKYYVPSGRCIQRPDRQEKAGNHPSSADEDGTEGDTIATADREVFYTNGGRVVYGGGGIVPDISVERETWKTVELNLERKSMFFDFAIKYTAAHPEIRLSEFEVTPAIMQEFRQFLREKNFTYKSALQTALEDMTKAVESENKKELFQANLDKMSGLIESEKETDFTKSESYIKRAIKREIAASLGGERAIYEKIILPTDPTIKQAVEVLTAPGKYAKLIKEGQRKADL